MLTRTPTPTQRELLLGKALVALAPSVAIAYAVYAVFLACVGLFAQPSVASALLRAPDLLAQLLFTPLVAGCTRAAARATPAGQG